MIHYDKINRKRALLRIHPPVYDQYYSMIKTSSNRAFIIRHYRLNPPEIRDVTFVGAKGVNLMI